MSLLWLRLFACGPLERVVRSLTVLCDNAAALALYRRFGFAIEGMHKSWIHRGGVLVDAHTMARVR